MTVGLRAQDVGGVLHMSLLAQEDISTLGGQGSHFRWYFGNDVDISLGQQRNLGWFQ